MSTCRYIVDLSTCRLVDLSTVVDNLSIELVDLSKRGSSAGRLACQSPRETPAWLCVHKAGLCQPCMLSGGPLCGASSLFLHVLACVAYFNVYICHIIAVKASMSENGGVWFTLGVQPVGSYGTGYILQSLHAGQRAAATAAVRRTGAGCCTGFSRLEMRGAARLLV